MSGQKICPYGFDCFHCPEKDCVCIYPRCTKWESKVMKGAHGRWEFENAVALYIRMKNGGMSMDEIRLGLSNLSNSFDKIQKAANRLQSEKRQEPITTKNITHD